MSKHLLVCMLGLVLVTVPFSVAAQDDRGEAYQQTILRIVEEGFNGGNLDVIDEVFAPDYVNHDSTGTIVDRESFKEFILAFRAAMPDLEVRVDMLLVEGDQASFRLMSTGTFRNELSLFPGLPPTGEPVELIKHVVLRFNEDGQIIEEWDLTDNLAFLTQAGVLPPMEGTTTEIFAIGRENKSWYELRISGLTGISEYTCTVGVDCSTEMFPSGLARAGYDNPYDYEDVEHVTIQFSLEEAYNNVILRLAKAGNETVVVTIDGERTYFVTNQMTGSADGGRFGAYNLRLGALEEGAHTIQLHVADDGTGEGEFAWDALSLFAM